MRLSFHVPRFWTRLVVIRLALLAAVCATVAGPYKLEAGAMFLGLAAIILIYRRMRLAKVPPVMELAADGLWLPRSLERSDRDVVPYDAVADVLVHATQRGDVLVVHSFDRGYAYPLSAFVDPVQLPAFVEELKHRIGHSPQREALRRELSIREQTARELFAKRVWLTPLLIGVLALVYLFEVQLGANEDALALVGLGANAPVLVRQGQWWRLFSSAMLHGPVIHFVFNAVSLLSIAALLERVVGRAAFWLVYVASAVMGSVVSIGLGRASASVGASAAIFGLLGALLIVQLRYSQTAPPGVQQSTNWWVTIGIINIGLPVVIPQIDWAAHAGGFVAGALVMLIVSVDMKTLGGKPSPVTLLMAGLATIFAGASLVMNGVRMMDESATASDEARVLDHLVESASATPMMLNEIAWGVAIRPSASEPLLAAAEKAADRAVTMLDADDNVAERAATLDTLATILHRRKQVDRAVAMERQALAEGEQPVLATTLAKFAADLPPPEPLGFSLDRSGTRLAFEKETPLEQCTTVVAERAGPDGAKKGAVVAYVGKGAQGRMLLDPKIGGDAGKDLDDEQLKPLAVFPCSSAEERLAPGYFSAVD